MRRWLAVLAIYAATMARAQNLPPPEIPLCPIEGLNAFMVNPLSVTGTNCQPKAKHPEFMVAKCWTRDPDEVIPAYATTCHCFENTGDFTPALIPGNYSIATSSCPAGVAAVLTSMVKRRGWATDAGCDDAGDLCSSAVGAFLAEDISPFHSAIVKKQRCHVFERGRQHCRTVE